MDRGEYESDGSSTLNDEIQQCIDDHIAKTGGGMVTAWHFIADLIDSDGRQSWLFSTPENQKQITTMGLLKWALGVAEYEQAKFLEQLNDE